MSVFRYSISKGRSEMRALIFNSGMGTRLTPLTENRPKGLIEIQPGESILQRQLRILSDSGVDEFVITTGQYPDQLMKEASPFVSKGCSISFVPNNLYRETNYIYSMYLAKSYLHTDNLLILHGDLVFDAAFAEKLITADALNACAVSATAPLPLKDFKAQIVDGFIARISVDIFDDECFACQPFYKLSRDSLDLWLHAVDHFVRERRTTVYAEEAANTVMEAMKLQPMYYDGLLVQEIDTREDLDRVKSLIMSR